MEAMDAAEPGFGAGCVGGNHQGLNHRGYTGYSDGCDGTAMVFLMLTVAGVQFISHDLGT